MKFKKITSAALSAAVMAGGVSAFAGFAPGGFSDEYTTGYYSETENAAAKAETAEMFAAKPDTKRRAEYLDRGAVAVPGDNGVLVSWRFLGTDPAERQYDLYKNGAKLNTAPISGSNFLDVSGKPGEEYTLEEIASGEKTVVKAWEKPYMEFAVKKYDTGDYIIDDGAVGDLDGDGQYELLLRRTPKDMNVETRVAYPIIEAYELTGEYMWTINIGPNEINEHDLNMMVYDFNGDGKSELIMRSFEGTTDGKGNTVTGVNGEVKDYSKVPDNLAIFKDRQYIISTPEYLSMYDGETGAELARTDLLPSQTPLSSWSYRYSDTGRLTKRASHHTFGLAYLDGVTPSFVEVRGAWDNVKAAAWHIENNQFVKDWEADTPNEENIDSIYGASNHNLTVVDVDFDGRDEIFSGPMGIDDDGSTLYAVKAQDAEGKWVKLEHGDAFDVAKMDPDFDGYYVWACHETANLPANIELHDARTGQVLFGYGKTKDTGRSRAADIDPTYKGYELWGSTATVPMNIGGEAIAEDWNRFYVRGTDGEYEKNEDGAPVQGSLPMNFMIHWDGDLLSEFLDGTRISKWNWTDKVIDVLLDAEGCMSNCGTKAVPCAAADLFGDWRDEVVWKTADENGIRVYSTSIETEYKIPTPMHDPYYRASVAMQNNHYNQPANFSYYMGAETETVPVPAIYTMKDGERIDNPDTVREYNIKVGIPARAAKRLILLVDSPYAYADSRIAEIDNTDLAVVPTIVHDNTLVPARFIAENLGYDVSWDGSTLTVMVTNGTKTIEMKIGSIDYTADGAAKTMETAPQIIRDRTMIPIRVTAEAFGKKVQWLGGERLIVIADDTAAPENAQVIAETLKTGKEPAPTPAPTPEATPTPEPTENPLAAMQYTEEDYNGETYKIYVNEDFSSYKDGDAAGWAGTKPAPIGTIGVSDGRMLIEGTDKGNRNAVYDLPGAMTGKAYIELDWEVGEMTGGTSVGELRFADNSGNVFLSFRTAKGAELEYNSGGAISNKGLETGEWTKVGTGFTTSGTVHIRAIADFSAKTVSFTAIQGSAKADVKDMKFEDCTDFAAVEVLAVRNEKNWNWSTKLDNLMFGMAD